MSEDGSFDRSRVTRRDFLHVAVIGSGAVLGASLVSAPASAANKIPQKAVGYQTSPKGASRCDNCSLWQAPSSCKLVDGTISPSGWCTLYKKK